MVARRPAFDENAREHIRRGLLLYKEQHAVGVPTLQLRIAEVMGDAPDRIPLKSLQRFLAGTHRTDDALVDHCATFLQTVVPPPPESQLADMLSQFLIGAPDQERKHKMPAGTFYSFIAKEDFPYDDDSRIPYSILTLKEASAPHYLDASETVINPERSSHLKGAGLEIFDPERQTLPLRYSGILLHYQLYIYILFLRNYFHMRYCLLHLVGPEGDDKYHNLLGTGLEPLLHPGLIVPYRVSNDFQIRYIATRNLRKAND